MLHIPTTQDPSIWRFLQQQHNQMEYQCRFKYEKGSIAFWDNRACQHRAIVDFFPSPRIGHRVTISGTRPFHDPNAQAATVQLDTAPRL